MLNAGARKEDQTMVNQEAAETKKKPAKKGPVVKGGKKGGKADQAAEDPVKAQEEIEA
jgi:hypothetical protein